MIISLLRPRPDPISTPAPTPTPIPAPTSAPANSTSSSPPLLTAKSFFISFAICVAGFILIWLICLLLNHQLERRRRRKKATKRKIEDIYWREFGKAILRIGPRDHVLFMVRHLDAIREDGSFPYASLGPDDKMFPILVDVIEGEDVVEEGKVFGREDIIEAEDVIGRENLIGGETVAEGENVTAEDKPSSGSEVTQS
ncbi:hypothetical protein IFR05_002254 [Cadophora sp. M221]|nr:hypothetical protein IFR05_002254 [Cadophora sp. M221]